ncbi:lariat debranching enzyme, C-terminal domain-containing protein [Paraphysoderma sedebokerense]|nr:lariat debranching enzyme, C-terminal domain-containing protein [Paraphysoderma sedebokerense]
MRIAVEGCCHGELDNIYASLKNIENQHNIVIDLLIICGDFQAIRNYPDLDAMAVPQKYKILGTFHKYYTGEVVAPYPTIFIGGNHEASSYLWELYHGGWVAPNIYFLGYAGIVRFGGLRIGGLTGIFKLQDYHKGRWELPPYNSSDIRSVYHVRKFETWQLSKITEDLDIFISHDWPTKIAFHGDVEGLITAKSFFAGEVQRGELGSPVNEKLLQILKPRYWFSAHLHVKFSAVYVHEQNTNEKALDVLDVNKSYNPPASTFASTPSNLSGAQESHSEHSVTRNPDEIILDDSSSDDDGSKQSQQRTVSSVPNPPPTTMSSTHSYSRNSSQPLYPLRNPPMPMRIPPNTKYTKFLALDKCLPKRDFLQIIDIEPSSNIKLDGNKEAENMNQTSGGGVETRNLDFGYDVEWLAIVKATMEYASFGDRWQKELPADNSIKRRIQEAREWIQEQLVPKGLLKIPNNFVMTAPGGGMRLHGIAAQLAGRPHQNPQTQYLCDLLQIPNRVNVNGVKIEDYFRGG